MIHQSGNSRGNYTCNIHIYENKSWLPHFHRNYELLYIITGTLTIYIDKVQHELNKGEIILIPPGAAHSFSINNGTKIGLSVFSSDYIAFFAKNNSIKSYSKFRCSKYVEDFFVKALFYEEKPSVYMIKAALYAICDECLKKAHVLSEKPDAEFAFNVMDYLQQNYTTLITMKSLAEKLGYEYHYFSTRFHQYFGMDFKKFLNMYRFEMACQMLKNTESTLTCIALESGFQSIRNFNKVFKSLSGLTPSEYRGSYTQFN